MRADRLLSILLLLQSRGQVTARELAERLEVSPRTIHRDMESLSMAGVPVYALRGSGGGWVLPDDYRTETAGLNEAEVRAIFMANPQRLLADLGLKGASEQGLIKLLSALPSSHRHDAEQIRQRLHIDVSGWRAVFWLLATCGVLGLIAVAAILPETSTGVRSSGVVSTYLALLRDPSYLGYTLAGGLGNAGLFAYIGISTRNTV